MRSLLKDPRQMSEPWPLSIYSLVQAKKRLASQYNRSGRDRIRGLKHALQACYAVAIRRGPGWISLLDIVFNAISDVVKMHKSRPLDLEMAANCHAHEGHDFPRLFELCFILFAFCRELCLHAGRLYGRDVLYYRTMYVEYQKLYAKQIAMANLHKLVIGRRHFTVEHWNFVKRFSDAQVSLLTWAGVDPSKGLRLSRGRIKPGIVPSSENGHA
jgi:hypothetical protein